MNNKNKSFLVRNQFPAKFQETSGNLISFVEAYYEWLDSGVRNKISNFDRLLDIDESIEEFFNFFKYELLSLFPSDVAVDKATLAKKVKDFYISKGTPKAAEFFFSAVYNSFAETVVLDNLQLDVGLSLYDELVMRVALFGDIDLTKLVSSRIVSSLDSSKTATPKFITLSRVNGTEFYEISFQEINTVFGIGESFYFEDYPEITGTVYPIITNTLISSGGTGFEVGTTVAYGSTGNGVGVIIRVSEVDSQGTITKLAIVDPGINYTIAPTALQSFGNGAGASIDIFVGTLSKVSRFTRRFVAETTNIPTIDYDYYLLVDDRFGEFEEGETIEQYDEFGNVTFSATVKDWVPSRNYLILVKTITGTFDPEKLITGTTSGSIRKPTISKLVRIDTGDGEVNKQYTYRLRTVVTPQIYGDLYKKNSHPAGLKYVPEVLLDVTGANRNPLSLRLYADSNYDVNKTVDGYPIYRNFYVKFENTKSAKPILADGGFDTKLYIDSLGGIADFFDYEIAQYANSSTYSYHTAGIRYTTLLPDNYVFDSRPFTYSGYYDFNGLYPYAGVSVETYIVEPDERTQPKYLSLRNFSYRFFRGVGAIGKVYYVDTYQDALDFVAANVLYPDDRIIIANDVRYGGVSTINRVENTNIIFVAINEDGTSGPVTVLFVDEASTPLITEIGDDFAEE